MYVIFVSIWLLTAYKCEKNEVEPEIQFLESFLADSLFKKPIPNLNGTALVEIGLSFKPKTNGTITKLAVKCPKAGNYRLSFWNADTQKLLFESIITQEKPETKQWVDISLQGLLANQPYTFSLQTTNWYYYLPKQKGIFPYQKNNILYLGNGWAPSGNGQFNYPGFKDDSYYAGDIDFAFKPN